MTIGGAPAFVSDIWYHFPKCIQRQDNDSTAFSRRFAYYTLVHRRFKISLRRYVRVTLGTGAVARRLAKTRYHSIGIVPDLHPGTHV